MSYPISKLQYDLSKLQIYDDSHNLRTPSACPPMIQVFQARMLDTKYYMKVYIGQNGPAIQSSPSSLFQQFCASDEVVYGTGVLDIRTVDLRDIPFNMFSQLVFQPEMVRLTRCMIYPTLKFLETSAFFCVKKVTCVTIVQPDVVMRDYYFNEILTIFPRLETLELDNYSATTCLSDILKFQKQPLKRLVLSSNCAAFASFDAEDINAFIKVQQQGFELLFRDMSSE